MVDLLCQMCEGDLDQASALLTAHQSSSYTNQDTGREGGVGETDGPATRTGNDKLFRCEVWSHLEFEGVMTRA